MPARFIEHLHPTKAYKGKGLWRTAAGEVDEITSLVIDCDNEQPSEKVTFHDVLRNLGMVAVTPLCFGYDSYSATVDGPRFRLVIEPDRPMSRIEVRMVMAWINLHAANKQFDMSMADRAHYAIAPHATAAIYVSDGPPLPIDLILERVAAEVEHDVALPWPQSAAARTSHRRRHPARPCSRSGTWP